MAEDESAKKSSMYRSGYTCGFFALSSSAIAERSDFAAEEHFSAAC